MLLWPFFFPLLRKSPNSVSYSGLSSVLCLELVLTFIFFFPSYLNITGNYVLLHHFAILCWVRTILVHKLHVLLDFLSAFINLNVEVHTILSPVWLWFCLLKSTLDYLSRKRSLKADFIQSLSLSQIQQCFWDLALLHCDPKGPHWAEELTDLVYVSVNHTGESNLIMYINHDFFPSLCLHPVFLFLPQSSLIPITEVSPGSLCSASTFAFADNAFCLFVFLFFSEETFLPA